MTDDDIPVPEDVDEESYRRGYRAALGMVREACAMLEVGLNQQDGDEDGDVLVKTDSEDRSDGEADSDDECPDCGGALVPELGGRRCPACGYRDDEPTESSDEPDLSDLINDS